MNYFIMRRFGGRDLYYCGQLDYCAELELFQYNNGNGYEPNHGKRRYYWTEDCSRATLFGYSDLCTLREAMSQRLRDSIRVYHKNDIR